MIRNLLVFFLLLDASFVGRASAADLDTLAPAPLAVPQAEYGNYLGTGWYIRGDIGYSRPQGPSGTYNGAPFDHLSVVSSAVLGGGVGYKFNNWLRADLTGDYTFAGNMQASYIVPNCCLATDKTGLGGWALLANGYVDLGTWSSITPYVGAGAGYAFTEVSKTVNEEFVQAGSGVFLPLTDPTTGQPILNAFPAHTTGRFAWALMAGAAIDVAPSVKVDLGYRYLNISDARFATDMLGIAPRLKSLGEHQFRLGLRYMFDE
ncbi:MAG: porin family protein [Hyphomicrobiales bacterium]|nr:porin family protein [Hyphomicrobiales bacterium]